MSIEAMVAVFSMSEARLGDRLTLLAIADNADDDGANAFPLLSTIARKARMSDRQVRRSIQRLQKARELIVEPYPGDARRSQYSIPMVANWQERKRTICPVSGGEKADNMSGSRKEIPDKSDTRKRTNRTETGGHSLLSEPADKNNLQKSVRKSAPHTALHPSVALCRDRGARPAKAVYPTIAKSIGDGVGNLERWGAVVSAWIGSGWSPRNIRGMLEYFARNEIPGQRRSGNGKAGNDGCTPPPPPAIHLNAKDILEGRHG